MEDVSNFCPAMAVPTTVKIPEPITAPMPRAVNETGPSVLVNLRSALSESEISLSIDLQQNSWLRSSWEEPELSGSVVVGGCAKRPLGVDAAATAALHFRNAQRHAMARSQI